MGREMSENQYEEATIAGGCFWCMEPVFDKLDGIVSVTTGYTGGRTGAPSYEEVCAGTTGHAEAIRIVFDPEKISYSKLLDIFWRNIDPTVRNRQFCDVGTQYRTAVFYHSAEQKRIAEESKRELELSGKTVLTEIVPASEFYPAEDYHQKFYLKNPSRYHAYHEGCGRDQRLRDLWGGKREKKTGKSL
jgi:peptide-methionine (S)-S-oxide reductase